MHDTVTSVSRTLAGAARGNRRYFLTTMGAVPVMLGLDSITAWHDTAARKKHKKKKKGKGEKKGGGSTPPPPKSEEARFLELINEYRATTGVAPLTRQSQLDAAAQFHAEDMATHDYLGYTLSNGQTWDENIASFGYSGSGPWGGEHRRRL